MNLNREYSVSADHSHTSSLQVFTPWLRLVAICLTVLTTSRLGLMAWQAQHFDTGLAIETLINGLRVDLMTLSMVLALPALALMCLPTTWLRANGFRRAMTLWFGGWLAFIGFMEAVTPYYVEFFGVRPARIFFEYLDRPREVAGLIAGDYLDAAAVAAFLPLAMVLLWRRKRGCITRWNLQHRLLLIPLILLLFLAGRSTLGHRPANPSTFAISNNQLVNDLGLNSTYRLLYTLYSLRHEQDPGSIYPSLPDNEVIKLVKADSGIPPEAFIDDATTLHRFGAGDTPDQPKHILIIVEESLGARFVGALGGLPLTPNLDTLSNKGIWFEHLYATGIRSARGLEAVITGFPPSPARSVLKLPLSQTGFYTLANNLRPLGYRSRFIYGGEAHFDNMQGFFLNNGFDFAIDIDDYDEWEFKGTWGVSDEDLFNRTHKELSYATGPVFAVAFTSSFHSPFEFPDGKIELYNEPKATKYNAVKYADYALGQFLAKAESSEYWDDTIVLIVADHDERPRGFNLVPVSSFHIPGVILGGGIEPQKISRVVSQIDLAPTLLSLAGISGTTPLLSENVLDQRADEPGRALMQYGDNHAYMKGNTVIIHRPDLPTAQFLYHPTEDRLEPQDVNPELARTAQAWALMPGVLYKNGLYHLQNTNKPITKPADATTANG